MTWILNKNIQILFLKNQKIELLRVTRAYVWYAGVSLLIENKCKGLVSRALIKTIDNTHYDTEIIMSQYKRKSFLTDTQTTFSRALWVWPSPHKFTIHIRHIN